MIDYTTAEMVALQNLGLSTREIATHCRVVMRTVQRKLKAYTPGQNLELDNEILAQMAALSASWSRPKSTPEAEPAAESPGKILLLQDQVKQLQKSLKDATKQGATSDWLRETVFELHSQPSLAPDWLENSAPRDPRTKSPGTPTLVLSDFHWGEVVDGSEVMGANSYDLTTAASRLRYTTEKAIEVCFDHFKYPNYNGIVVPLLGDMVSGDIHDELLKTNELPVLPTALDCADHLEAALQLLIARFGQVFVPCVTGNHGRQGKKIQHKQRHYTSYDWLIYCLLESRFKSNPHIKFAVSTCPDYIYKINDHRFLITHGDQLGNGGDGIIGFIGPVVRGDTAKRKRLAAMGISYDTLLHGHYHTPHNHQERILGNGALVGMGEYSFNNNYSYSPPKQLLFFTHPVRKINYYIPIDCEPPKPTIETNWLTFTSPSSPPPQPPKSVL